MRVADPESGLRKYSRERFLESWTGYAAVIADGEGLEEQPVQKVDLGWIEPFLKPYTRLLVIATVLAAFAAGLELVLPLVTARIFDHVLKPGAVHQVHTLSILTGLIAAVVIAMSVASLTQRYLLSRGRGAVRHRHARPPDEDAARACR